MTNRIRALFADLIEGAPGAWGLKWLASFALAAWVSIPSAFQSVVVLVAIDYAMGVLRAIKQRRLSSREGREGLIRKAAMLLLLWAMNYAGKKSFDLPPFMCSGFAMAFSMNELISITENAAEIGVPIPSAWLDLLSRVKRITGRGRPVEKVKQDLEG